MSLVFVVLKLLVMDNGLSIWGHVLSQFSAATASCFHTLPDMVQSECEFRMSLYRDAATPFWECAQALSISNQLTTASNLPVSLTLRKYRLL